MKIELKNIHHSVQLSEETEAFTANLYIKGIHAGYAKNNGTGGPTDYYHENEKGRELIREAEAYCRTLPDKQYPKDRYMEAFSVPMNLENYIDDIVNRYIEKKEQASFAKKMDKAMERGIVFGIAGESFTTLAFTSPFAKVLSHPKATEIITNAIVNKVLPDLKDGNIILNTNIPESILREAGLKKEQYVKPLVGDQQQPDLNKDAGQSAGPKR
ncbi:MAG: hypothetical protein EOO20_00455 [Chryseobacterium sp.]|nr:MAG: hypothetical protein EOO20_00455 [Chryseobacterium sp.]